MKVNEVKFRDDLYPRIDTCPETVQKYAEDLSVLPPIQVNQHGELIDGWHRWTAHKKKEVEEIAAEVIETRSDAHLLELAIETNATHGLQLSQNDKKKMATRLYRSFLDEKPSVEQKAAKKAMLAKILSVSEATVRNWTSRTDKDDKDEKRSEIFAMWLACHTQQEIADAVGWKQQQVAEEVKTFTDFDKFSKISKSNQNRALHETDFDPPIYNVWKQQSKTNSTSHFGNSEVRWVDNLLYLYTNPFDVVVDPFGGGGSTIDICKKRLRRYWVSDRKPIVEREKEIRKHDLLDGPIGPKQWKDVKLVYLDPPYWVQAQGQYSDDDQDLANQSLEKFTENLTKIIKDYSKKLTDAYIALIIQPTQWKAPEKGFVDHIGDMLRVIKLPVEMRYSVPYESQQCTAQMVEWAKENKRCLVLSREIVVWRVQ